MRNVHFTKMHGLGNDFVVINNLDGSVQLEKQRICELSDRRTGIGFDQMLIIEPATVEAAQFNYRIFNADGGEVEHCGNGARCFAQYVHDKGLTNNQSILVNTTGGLINLHLLGNSQVMVEAGVPVFEPAAIPFLAPQEQNTYEIEVGDTALTVGAAAIGNPHVLVQVDNVETAPVDTIGPLLESHERFPKRVNVGFMQIIDTSNIKLRVFERGVGETRACGTGACAAVAIGIKQGLLDKSVSVTLPGGTLSDVPNADSVLKFLTHNPDFFNQHADVLPRLSIPHHTGAAISLIEKQVSVLRNKCCTLENSLRDLINVARENEQLHQRLHHLIQDIITASSINDVVNLTRDNMLANFNADDVRVVLISSKKQTEPAVDYEILPETDPGLALFHDIFKKRDTRCGALSDAQTKLVFGADAQNVASAAVIPLYHNRKLGLVVLASKDETRINWAKYLAVELNRLAKNGENGCLPSILR